MKITKITKNTLKSSSTLILYSIVSSIIFGFFIGELIEQDLSDKLHTSAVILNNLFYGSVYESLGFSFDENTFNLSQTLTAGIISSPLFIALYTIIFGLYKLLTKLMSFLLSKCKILHFIIFSLAAPMGIYFLVTLHINAFEDGKSYGLRESYINIYDAMEPQTEHCRDHDMEGSTEISSLKETSIYITKDGKACYY